ncbi:hypothetical protein LXL04_004819 [Taraxacum kok-saghyz]
MSNDTLLIVDAHYSGAFCPKPLLYFDVDGALVRDVDFSGMVFLEFITFLKKFIKKKNKDVYCFLPNESLDKGWGNAKWRCNECTYENRANKINVYVDHHNKLLLLKCSTTASSWLLLRLGTVLGVVSLLLNHQRRPKPFSTIIDFYRLKEEHDCEEIRGEPQGPSADVNMMGYANSDQTASGLTAIFVSELVHSLLQNHKETVWLKKTAITWCWNFVTSFSGAGILLRVYTAKRKLKRDISSLLKKHID